MNLLYQILADTGETIRREVCMWEAVLTAKMHEVMEEKEVVLGVAKFLLGNAVRLDEISALANDSTPTSDLPGVQIQTLVQPSNASSTGDLG